jgi:alkylresorcinol/alkylpyrone synthase
LPGHRLTQDEARDEVRRQFTRIPDLERLLPLFDRSGVRTRYFAYPKEYYLDGKTFGRRNDDYIEIAQALGEKAVRTALERAGLVPGDVDAFLFTTTTGLSTPSVDALLAHRMGMRGDVRRMPFFGLGCAGGAALLGMAADYLRTRPDGVAVVLAVELCSLTLLLQDNSKTNLIGMALFGDGAAAAVLTGAKRGMNGPAIIAAETEYFENSLHLMGWHFSEAGFELVLSPTVPAFILEALPPRVSAFWERHGLRREDLRHFALHPGGRQVLEAYRRGLGLGDAELAPTREALRNYGNLSSASVLFSLNELLETTQPQPGERGFMTALGPGFAAEMLLLEW